MHPATTRSRTAARAGAPRTPVAGPQGKALLTELRDATAAAHRLVEARLFPAALTDRASYAAMLRVLLALHEPLEARFLGLSGFAALGVDLPGRRKAPLLRADLIELDCVVPARSARPAAPADDLPAALGAFYVLEGSTLGGRVLLDEVRTRLGEVPTSFLTGYGAQTGRRWTQTRAALVAGVEAAPCPEQAARRLIGGASGTFAELAGLLDESGWPA